MEDNDDKGYGTINIDKVLQVLKGAQEGMRMAFPTPGINGASALPTEQPEVETRKGVLHVPPTAPTKLL